MDETERTAEQSVADEGRGDGEPSDSGVERELGPDDAALVAPDVEPEHQRESPELPRQGMKNAGRCTMCSSVDYWIVDPVRSNARPVPVASYEGRGFLAADTPVGHFVTYICQQCGYTEFWASDIDELREDDQRGIAHHGRSAKKEKRGKKRTAKPRAEKEPDET